MDATLPRKLRVVPAAVAVSLGCAFGIFAFSAAMGFTGSRVAGVAVAVVVAVLVGCVLWLRPIVALDQNAAPSALKVISALATVAALIQLARICVFMVNPAATAFAIGPQRAAGLSIRHSCLSAYYVAARSALAVPNVYSYDLYSLPQKNPEAQRVPRPIATFDVDAYEYPPPFLLLPRALAVAIPDFLRFRMVWFGLTGTVALLGLLVVLPMLGAGIATRALLLSPLIFASDLMILTLQIGNFQAMIFAFAMIAMVLIARRHYAVGGALLAFATVSKLFPGFLVVYFIVRRRWRALGWTVGFCAVFVILSLLDTGRTPYRAFMAHLPRLLSGESFPAFRFPEAIAKNLSVPGMVFKLQLFGLVHAPFAAMRVIGQIYTLLALAVTVLIAKRPLPSAQRPLAWLAILAIASFRSPFLPQYGVIPALWLLTLVGARLAPTVKNLSAVLLAWVIVNIPAPQGLDVRVVSILLLFTQAVMLILVIVAVRTPQPMRQKNSATELVPAY
ncbi:MAG TPA: glycosyltransferase family 87 protein [Acidobacteriaceae bacterium]|nr:glycosyltransferase family 87 protein [Acidobacteriaceae bacterium]